MQVAIKKVSHDSRQGSVQFFPTTCILWAVIMEQSPSLQIVNPEARRASRSYSIVSKLYSLIINIQIFLNIIWKGKGKRVNNGYCCYHRTIRFFKFFLLKNQLELNKTSSGWTGSRFSPGCINKEYYFPVWFYFWVKTGPWTPLIIMGQKHHYITTLHQRGFIYSAEFEFYFH